MLSKKGRTKSIKDTRSSEGQGYETCRILQAYSGRNQKRQVSTSTWVCLAIGYPIFVRLENYCVWGLSPLPPHFQLLFGSHEHRLDSMRCELLFAGLLPQFLRGQHGQGMRGWTWWKHVEAREKIQLTLGFETTIWKNFWSLLYIATEMSSDGPITPHLVRILRDLGQSKQQSFERTGGLSLSARAMDEKVWQIGMRYYHVY